MKTISAGGFRSLQAFGIHSGYQRVALLVEPMGASTDQTRGRLLIDEDRVDKDLPWDRWADEFAGQLPQVLRDLVADSAGQGARRDRRELMRRLQELAAAMPMPVYIADDDGPDTTGTATHGNRRAGQPSRQAALREARRRQRPQAWRHVVSLFTREDGATARQEDGPIPEIVPEWNSRTRGQRPAGVLDDLAATYLIHASRAQISEDFRGYTTFLGYFHAQYGTGPGVGDVVDQEVKAACEDQLIEYIVGVLRVRCEPHWDTGRIEKALSDEALTGCLMQHASLAGRIGERLNRRLRKAAA